ncbi:DJ-1/PfpI family protein [Cyanobium sp. WAJ14-Wanaka]|uniref:DJ-1/PfpI family protein n=1 Tax=Cyanobium sp. WAJ14-Wanaka TaxID=2823725 RepID=UPI0020CDC2B3|nr:DJ-1/PfpI family protein [Cyanobium sp. WAJ14-Wanaka]MCP9775911.1 DJ-1/PfpI family protein [Cyanobium sp. WAJ14-Wanaka]
MASSKILVLVEEHYDETEFNVFNSFFPTHGVAVDYASYLWGNESLEFEGNDKTSKVKVDLCVSKVNLSDYKGLILIGGYAMDRLRYQTTLSGSRNTAPAVELLRTAVQRMDAGQLAIGTICHSLWLFCADPSLIKGRKVTCAHNIACDVENAGGELVVANGETVDTHSDGLLITGRHPGSVDAFDELFLSTIQAL